MLSLNKENSAKPNLLRRLCLAMLCVVPLMATLPKASADSVIVFGDLTDDAVKSYGAFHRAAVDVEGFLTAIKFNRPAISTTNYFAISVGGVDAIQDLEEGRGVDPDTLGALYAGYALPEVARHLNLKFERGGKIRIDAADGRLRYKGTVVRMYSPMKLRELYALRKALTDEDDRKRTKAFAKFTAQRLEALGSSDRSGANERVIGLDERYVRLRQASNRIAQDLRAETDLSTVLPATFQHLFSFSVGGLDTRGLLENHGVVDPESLSAIYASEIDAGEAANLQIDERGQLYYKSARTRLFSIVDLQECYRRRDILELQSKTR